MGSTGISVGGLASGLDTTNMINQLVALEQVRVTRIENKQESVNVSLTTYGTLVSNLTTLQRKCASLGDADQFDKYTLASSNETILTIDGRDGGMPGSFGINVFQLARSEKILSNSYASPITALGLSGEFTVNTTHDHQEENPAETAVTITIEAGDALKDIANKINAAAGGNLSASIMKLSATEYGLVFTSRETGSAGVTYTETVGTVLRDLGILDATGSKGNVTQALQSLANTAGGTLVTGATLFSAIDGAAAGVNDTITIRGTDHNGNDLSARTFVIGDPASTTVNDFLKAIESAFNGMVTASVVDGKITITDKSTGNSSLKVELTANNEGGGALSFGGLLGITTAGKNGVLQTGQDAFINIDGLSVSHWKNEVDDAVEGVTFKLKKAVLTETVTASIERDLAGVKAGVQELVDAFNLVLKYIDEQSKVKVTESEKNADSLNKKDIVEKGALAGDSTVNRLKSELMSAFTRQRDELTGSTYRSVASVGITFNNYTGEYEINSEKFEKALTRDYESVRKLFVMTGEGEDSSFLYGASTKYTKSNRYAVDVDALTVSRLDKFGAVTATYAAVYEGGVLRVDEAGDAQGLALTAPSSGGTLFTFSKGLGNEISDFIKQVTDTYDGYLTQRSKSLQEQIDRYDDDIADEQDRVYRYEERLKAQFSQLELTMSRLQSQSSQMLSQLG